MTDPANGTLPRWEYWDGTSPSLTSRPARSAWLNQQGRQGWELVYWTNRWNGVWDFVFKRRTRPR